MACIETLLCESLKRSEMACVCYFETLVGEREFYMETFAPLIEATLDLRQ